MNLCNCGCGLKTRNKYVQYHYGKSQKKNTIDYEIDGETECWIFLGYKTKEGYGKLRLPGTRNKKVWAHRYYYELYNGPIKEGYQIDHLCFNPSCVNPEHLREISLKDNMRSRKKNK